MEAIGISKIGLVRKQNEDRFHIGSSYCLIADGMGGYKGGEVASTVAVDSVRKAMEEAENPLSETSLREAVLTSNEAIYRKMKNQEGLEGMGTTLVLAAVQANHLLWANVGDSRLYVFRDGHLYQITTDHSVVQDMVDSGELTEEEASQSPKRNVLTRAVGIAPILAVDTGTVEIATGDRILLCSDGLSGYIRNDIIESNMQAEESNEQLLDNLVNLVYDQGARDNVTIIVGTI